MNTRNLSRSDRLSNGGRGMNRISLICLLALSLVSLNCGIAANRNDPNVPRYGYEVVHTWPHDAQAFTQGLVFADGKLLESTGQLGRSSLRRVELETGNVVKQINVADQYFAEGITQLNGKIYQLTWQDQLGFIYDAQSFEKVGQFAYEGEGWGLTNDGESLILSDGSNRIRFIDPNDFHVKKVLTVLDGGAPVKRINELEFVEGEIYANIWHKDVIARINPQTGRVVGWIDLQGILPRGDVSDHEAVLNGIAYDEANHRLFVTGKLWPKLFEIRLKR